MKNEAAIFEEFTRVAGDFVTLVEDPATQGASGLQAIRNSLLTLYTIAVHLPPVEISGDLDTLRKFKKSKWEEGRRLYLELQSRLPFNAYRCVYEPLETNGEALFGSLADDLSDIWYDLAPGIQLCCTTPVRQLSEVWWDWQFSFTSHWGRHAISALRAMHEPLLLDG